MSKWEYIKMISKRGTHYGTDGGVLDLLQWCDKPNTAKVTPEEAKEFWERYEHAGVQSGGTLKKTVEKLK